MANDTWRGFLYPKKDREGKQPNATGTINIDGTEYDLAGWSETSRHGVKYLSLKASPQRPDADSPAPPEPAQATIEDDDLPF